LPTFQILAVPIGLRGLVLAFNDASVFCGFGYRGLPLAIHVRDCNSPTRN